MVKKHYKLMGEKDFKLIKTLLTAGIPTTKIADITGRTWGTISVVKTTNSFEEYHEKVAERAKRYHAKAKGEVFDRPTQKIQPNGNGNIQAVGAILAEINSNVAEIRDAVNKISEIAFREKAQKTFEQKGWFNR